MPNKHSILKIALFDISYIISNCDDYYSINEIAYLNKLLESFDINSKKLLLIRKKKLDSILDKGFTSVTEFVKKMAKSLKKQLNDDLKNAYIKLLYEVILLDKEIHENEKILFNILCKEWEVDNRL